VQRKLSAARTEASEAAAARAALSEEKSALEAKQGHDYGPEGAFAALVDRCVDAFVDKYTYRVCPFQRAQQLEGSSPTSLGSWDGFEGDYAVLRFKGGENCWQGPDRSINVALRCGRAEALARVAEPSRCEYSAEMTTPAACSEREVAALEAELRARTQALELGGKDEL
jgi:protein kinase C substrate 80K-H